MTRWLLSLVILAAPSALSQAPEESTAPAPPSMEAQPPPPMDFSGEAPLPPKAVGSDQLVPAVRIRREEGRTVEEYSVNGLIYMIKVTPKKGPAYYLIDTDGDGELETRDIESDQGLKPVYWKLFEWG